MIFSTDIDGLLMGDCLATIASSDWHFARGPIRTRDAEFYPGALNWTGHHYLEVLHAPLMRSGSLKIVRTKSAQLLTFG